ncbi:MAG: carbohydrate ABC transporter permease [Candidatus Bipolaricaulia bacterium]
MAKRILVRSMLHGGLLLITAIFFLPTLGLFITSFREPSVVTNSGWWTVLTDFWNVSQFTLENYFNIIEDENLIQHFWNSVQISVPATVLPILIGSMAAYALAWMKFPGRRLALVFMVVMLVIPLHITFVPILRAYLGIEDALPIQLTGSIPGLFMAHTGYGLPLAVFLLFSFMLELPKELFESAAIDGANTWQAFWRIVFPLALPGMASIAIFQFIWVWNSLLVTLIFIQPGSPKAPLNVVVTQIGQMGQDWHNLTAAAFFLIIVPMIIFFSLQRYFVRGLLGGSVKG